MVAIIKTLREKLGESGLSAHARLSPSSAESWMTCAGYPAAIEGLPNETNKAAAEGTAAHQISDDCLTLGLDAYDFIGSSLKVDQWTFEWTDDDADYLQPGIDQTREFGGIFYGEHKVDLSEWLGPGQFGTLDRGIIRPDLIVISDLKYGRGMPVSPVRNKQLMLYSLGFWRNVARHLTNTRDFLIVIDQPRCSGGGGEWRTTLDELLAFGEEARRAAALTLDPLAERTASVNGCAWCARRNAPGGCDTYDRFIVRQFDMALEDFDLACEKLALPAAMTPERRSNILMHKNAIESWLETLHAECLRDALYGEPTPGLKAVDGRRPHRKWKDATEVEKVLFDLLGDAAYNKKLLSVAQAVKALGNDRQHIVSGHIDRGDAKPVLVPEADARPARTLIYDLEIFD